MTVYYNENDPKAAVWLRELILRGHIAHGDIDERSIADVHPVDLLGYDQCHFFAGIGGWSYALRLAGWPDDRPVWTGSCPCQPFSVAGKREGTADKRHLWPEFARLIAQHSPATVFGEQVASKDGRIWLAGVRLDLEGMGYGVGAADLCAAGVGAPHIRQRLYWVADTECGAAERYRYKMASASGGMQSTTQQWERIRHDARNGITIGRLAFPDGGQSGDGELQRSRQHGQQPQDGGVGWMGDASKSGHKGCDRSENLELQGNQKQDGSAWTAGAWSDSDSIACTDGKSRRVESGTFPLAHGIPARMGRLRGYGNAIVPQVAAEFILASA